MSATSTNSNRSSPSPALPVLVQKYGGATLATPQKIRAVAEEIAQVSKQGRRLIVVVSAMGKTTNSLIDLAHEVSPRPDLREMDMLLTVGERISMALLSMALNDLGCPAISFTGSQAGVITNHSHVNAMILEVRPPRVEQALAQGKVVILAGFQGVASESKEITTLGRGGTDTTAVAMATAFRAERCEIRKDVPSVFTADPQIVPEAKKLHQLNYEQMLEMTFWGAKVLHYRSVDLARSKKVKIYVGPAASSSHSLKEDGTVISESRPQDFESSRPLALNSHHWAVKIQVPGEHMTRAWDELLQEFQNHQMAFGQLLFSQKLSSGFEFVVTGPAELLKSIRDNQDKFQKIKVDAPTFTVVSLTCTGTTNPQVYNSCLETLKRDGIFVESLLASSMTLAFLILEKDGERALRSLHTLI